MRPDVPFKPVVGEIQPAQSRKPAERVWNGSLQLVFLQTQYIQVDQVAKRLRDNTFDVVYGKVQILQVDQVTKRFRKFA